MKKRKFKQFFREYGDLIGCLLGILSILGSFLLLFIGDISGWIKIIFNAGAVIFIIVGITRSYRNEKQKAEAAEKRSQEFEKQNKYYIDLVNNQVQKTLDKFKNELLDAFDIDTSLEYLISFEEKKDWICENRIVGKPDSFIVASCLMYSLIDYPIFITKGNEGIEKLKEIQIDLNLDLAMNCAFQIISEPSSYYKDNTGFFVEEKHPKVDIVVPNGIIKNSELYQRIIATIYRDELVDNRTSIMQFSNLLHLIYLNCQ